jgi:transposase-like protein
MLTIEKETDYGREPWEFSAKQADGNNTRQSSNEAVPLVTEGELSIAQAARDMGLNNNLLSRSIEIAENEQHTFPSQGHSPKRQGRFRLNALLRVRARSANAFYG